MKRILITLLALLVFVNTLGSFGLIVSAAPLTTTLSAVKDSWVCQTGPLVSTDVDVANPYNLKVQKDSNTDNNRITFIEFNLSSITGSITNATLDLKCSGVQASAQTVQAYETTPLLYSWPSEANDNGMTGANAPTLGAAIPGASALFSTNGSIYTLNVTSYIQSRYNSGAKKVTIGFQVTSANLQYIFINSIEGGTPAKLNVTATTVPTISVTAPYSSSYYNVGDTVTAKANVKTNGSGVTISNVAFNLDDVQVAGTPTLVGSTYSLDIPNLTLGTHTIKVVATNSDGGVTTSTPVSINVLASDTTLTKPAPKSAEAGAYIIKGNTTTNYGSATTYSLMVKNDITDTSDNISYLRFNLSSITDTIVNATVKLYCSGVQTAGQAVQAVQAYSITDDTWTSLGLLPGNAPALGTAISGAVSNINTSGDVGYFDITSYVKSNFDNNDKLISMAFFTDATSTNYIAFDSRNGTNYPTIFLTTTKAPVINITSPLNGARFDPASSVILNADVTDTDGTIASVQGYFDGNPITLSNTGSVYSATVSNLLVGSHTLKVKATDNLGAVTEMTNTINVAYPYEIISNNFTDALIGTGNVVTTLTAGSELRSNITIKNNNADSLPTTIIIALYDGTGVIKMIDFNKNNIAGNTQQTVTAGITLPAVVSGYYAKAYLWDDLSNMQPLIPFNKIPTP